MKYQEEDLNHKSKKLHWKILNCFTSHEKMFLNYLMIILQFDLRLNTNQFMEKGQLKILTQK